MDTKLPQTVTADLLLEMGDNYDLGGKREVFAVQLAEEAARRYNEHGKLLTALRAISDAYASDGNTKRQKAAFALVRSTLKGTA